MLTVGIKGKEEIVVTDANSAKTMGSGTLDVFATPAMIALMEKTAWKSVAPYLEEGCGTVGTLLNVTHDAPTPLGMKVWCESDRRPQTGILRGRLRRNRKDRRGQPRTLYRTQ